MKRNSRLLAGFALLTAIAIPAGAIVALPSSADTLATRAPSVPAGSPVPALTRAAYPLKSVEPASPLRDLRPLTRMIGGATVVGAGEATHNSHEFVALKHKMFRELVAEKGFTTFALEASWSTGLALDRYVTTGVGEPREIMRREFQASYRLWNIQEYLDLIEWMRQYNKHHPRKLHFIGDDLGYVGPEVIDRVTGHVARTRPQLLPEITRLYAGIRSTAEVAPWTSAYLARSLAERVALEVAARQALAKVKALPASPARHWAVQNARAVWQVTKFFSHDVTDVTELAKAYEFRDRTMADNVTWWNRTTGGKVLVSAHNGHIAYESSMPETYPVTQGEFLRRQLGKRYVAVGLSFDRGSFNAADIEDPNGTVRKFTIGPAPAGNNEHTVGKVPYRNFVVDLRRLPASATSWLAEKRPTRDIGTGYPYPDSLVALGKSYDILIHLDQVTAADLLTT
ncbi:erythromycin esterase family protein [Kribbella sp. CA-293567]|uniref:erythromycin esterase family protein n=1 Tax=Kribbella sp. CA-293567 TaxID=3002436 RepID=UPI0022DD864F|nr:erythromycin esterase family protein [Kribbella sp. CA-293567]WBQ03427.1 erythromycin esterase family protein [Kribbella sp. CA-293567]